MRDLKCDAVPGGCFREGRECESGWALVQRGAGRWPQEDSSFLNCSSAVRGNFKSEPKNKDSCCCCGALSLFKGLTTTCRERESQLPKHAVLRRPNQIHPLHRQLCLLRKWHIAKSRKLISHENKSFLSRIEIQTINFDFFSSVKRMTQSTVKFATKLYYF